MHAVQLRAYDGKPESIAVVEMPVARPGPGEVLVRVFASPINPSDLMFIRELYGFKKPSGSRPYSDISAWPLMSLKLANQGAEVFRSPFLRSSRQWLIKSSKVQTPVIRLVKPSPCFQDSGSVFPSPKPNAVNWL
jgi:hypothetical protein